MHDRARRAASLLGQARRAVGRARHISPFESSDTEVRFAHRLTERLAPVESPVRYYLSPLIPLMEVILFWMVGGLLALVIVHVR